MTDNWESEEGYICQGAVIGFVELGTAAVAGECLKFGTSAANKIVMSKWAINSDSVAVSLKGGVTGDKIPVCFYGVMKMVAHRTVEVGAAVANAATAGTTITYGNVNAMTTHNTINHLDYTSRRYLGATGTAWSLGMALQAGAVNGDEILVLVGGAR